MPLTVGTAGHIDHGKTWLVRALTGKDTDRLPEEKERGISIDLGYAPLDLPDGTRLSLIDVPGHERFIRNMVAGASGIDLFLLVIDATEGARPQTHEHLAILRLLGIEHGVVAVTKADAADPETLELVVAEARELVPGAAVVAVSAKTGEGLDELRAALACRGRAARAPTRCSARRGSTSTAPSRCTGSAPSSRARSGRARSARATSSAPSRPGSTSACGASRCTTSRSSAPRPGSASRSRCPGSSASALHRGDALVEPGAYPVSYRLDVELDRARADRRSRAGARAPRDDRDSRPARARRRAVRAAAARVDPVVAARGDRVRPARRDDARRRPRPRSGSPTRTGPRPARAARDGRSGVDRRRRSSTSRSAPTSSRPARCSRPSSSSRASRPSGVRASGTSRPTGSSRLERATRTRLMLRAEATPLDPGVQRWPSCFRGAPWADAVLPLLDVERAKRQGLPRRARRQGSASARTRPRRSKPSSSRRASRPSRSTTPSSARFLEESGRLVRIGDGLAIGADGLRGGEARPRRGVRARGHDHARPVPRPARHLPQAGPAPARALRRRRPHAPGRRRTRAQTVATRDNDRPQGAAWARWPSWSSKPVRSCNPRLGRFDSCAAPLHKSPGNRDKDIGCVSVPNACQPGLRRDELQGVEMSRFRVGLAVAAVTMTALAVPGSFTTAGGAANGVHFLEGPLQPCVRALTTERAPSR